MGRGQPQVVLPLGGAAALIALSPAAFASGTSPRTNGCYSTWGSTGTNAHCRPATVTGHYRNHASCDFQSDPVSGWIYITRNSTVDNWGQLYCTFNISSARVEFTG